MLSRSPGLGLHDVSMSEEIALRPVREDDLPVLEKLTRDPERAGEYEWFGWSDLLHWRTGWDENGLIGPDGGTLIVADGGQRLGLVNWYRQLTVPGSPGSYCWEIGIVLLPEARGRGYGAQAQRLLARYLFAHTTAHRIWAWVEVGNIAEQKALEKAAFTREGVTRGAWWRDGAWRDGIIYGLLRTDPTG
jgi:RimJ/RimL family protein N-acetyltransferase